MLSILIRHRVLSAASICSILSIIHYLRKGTSTNKEAWRHHEGPLRSDADSSPGKGRPVPPASNKTNARLESINPTTFNRPNYKYKLTGIKTTLYFICKLAQKDAIDLDPFGRPPLYSVGINLLFHDQINMIHDDSDVHSKAMQSLKRCNLSNYVTTLRFNVRSTFRNLRFKTSKTNLNSANFSRFHFRLRETYFYKHLIAVMFSYQK